MNDAPSRAAADRERIATLVRAVVLLTVLVMSRLGGVEGETEYLDALLAGGAAYVLITSLPGVVAQASRQVTLIVSALDLLAITALISLTGGPSSAYYVLYYLPVLHASVRLDLRDAVGSSVLAGAAYLLVIVLQGPDIPVVTNSWLRALTFGASTLIMALFFALMAREARTYRDLSQRYQQLSDSKSDFLAAASHELRTPLTAIVGFSLLLLDAERRVKPREYLRIIHEEARRLHRMIEGLLDLSRIEAGCFELRLSEVALPQLVAEVLSLWRVGADERRFAVRTAPDLQPVFADRDRLFQVIANLVGNAVKYSPPNAEIEISAQTSPTETVVSVADHGPGISAEQMPLLFRKFRRLESSVTENVEGTGLGLAISKSIIEMHGGRMWVESRLGEGTVFNFAIPRVAESVAGAEPEVAAVDLRGLFGDPTGVGGESANWSREVEVPDASA